MRLKGVIMPVWWILHNHPLTHIPWTGPKAQILYTGWHAVDVSFSFLPLTLDFCDRIWSSVAYNYSWTFIFYFSITLIYNIWAPFLSKETVLYRKKVKYKALLNYIDINQGKYMGMRMHRHLWSCICWLKEL